MKKKKYINAEKRYVDNEASLFANLSARWIGSSPGPALTASSMLYTDCTKSMKQNENAQFAYWTQKVDFIIWRTPIDFVASISVRLSTVHTFVRFVCCVDVKLELPALYSASPVCL